MYISYTAIINHHQYKYITINAGSYMYREDDGKAQKGTTAWIPITSNIYFCVDFICNNSFGASVVQGAYVLSGSMYTDEMRG